MNLTQEQIVKLIADAFRVGRAEGMEIGHKDGYENGLRDGDAEGYERGYEEGWDKGWEKGYDSGEADAGEETGFESGSDKEEYGSDKEEYACKCSQCADHRHYSMGWNDGYTEADIDPDMKDNEAYMDGFLQGRDDRENNVELV